MALLLVLVKIVMVLVSLCFASMSVAAVSVKLTAPETYTVKKGDTLWDIAALYLEKPWLWPELWRNNIQIQNPHLIYPGNVLRLVFNNQGEPELVLQPDANKLTITLSPKPLRQMKSGRAIPLLSWQLLQSHVEHDLVMNSDTYQDLPRLLGDSTGGIRFATQDIVFGAGELESNKSWNVVRKAGEIFDAQGRSLGVKVRHVADAAVLEATSSAEFLIVVEDANFESKPGDRLFPTSRRNLGSMTEFQAATTQLGKIVGSLQEHSLLGKYDIVILDLGEKEMTPGTVMGIYQQGPNIVNDNTPFYENAASDRVVSALWKDVIEQPAMKVGELVVFRVFEQSSFGLISSSTDIIRHGAIVGKP